MSRIAHGLKPSPYRSMFVMALLSIMMACIAAARAHVHHGADGTAVNRYPQDCCHDRDCRPVSRVRTLSDGFLMTTEDGTTVFVNAMRWRRPSQDNRWHVCFGAGKEPTIYCVFAPPDA
jgi:hypothetical protein